MQECTFPSITTFAFHHSFGLASPRATSIQWQLYRLPLPHNHVAWLPALIYFVSCEVYICIHAATVICMIVESLIINQPQMGTDRYNLYYYHKSLQNDSPYQRLIKRLYDFINHFYPDYISILLHFSKINALMCNFIWSKMNYVRLPAQIYAVCLLGHDTPTTYSHSCCCTSPVNVILHAWGSGKQLRYFLQQNTGCMAQ